MRSVTPAMADPSTMGDGRYPSVVAWCSMTTTLWKPSRSAHAACSTAARYRVRRRRPGVGGPHVVGQHQPGHRPASLDRGDGQPGHVLPVELVPEGGERRRARPVGGPATTGSSWPGVPRRPAPVEVGPRRSLGDVTRVEGLEPPADEQPPAVHPGVDVLVVHDHDPPPPGVLVLGPAVDDAVGVVGVVEVDHVARDQVHAPVEVREVDPEELLQRRPAHLPGAPADRDVGHEQVDQGVDVPGVQGQGVAGRQLLPMASCDSIRSTRSASVTSTSLTLRPRRAGSAWRPRPRRAPG